MTATAPPRPRLRPLALPTQHGVWGFVLEPALLGLLLAPSFAGALLALAGVAAVLTQHPLELALRDRRRKRSYPRTRWAWRLATLYAATGAALAGGALVAAGSLHPLIPLAAAAPLAALQLRWGVAGRAREALSELLGPAALGALAAAVAVAGGAPFPVALVAWAAVTLRAGPTVLYVRSRLRLDRHRPTRPAIARLAHELACAAILALIVGGAIAPVAALGYAALALRAWRGLSARRRRLEPKWIGLRELLYGVALVALIAAGFHGLGGFGGSLP